MCLAAERRVRHAIRSPEADGRATIAAMCSTAWAFVVLAARAKRVIHSESDGRRCSSRPTADGEALAWMLLIAHEGDDR